MSFSKQLCQTREITPNKGELTGTCCVCGEPTKCGHEKKFGKNMTCADYLQIGEVICPECYYLVKNSNEYRRTMFLLTKTEFTKFKKKEAKDIIFNLPNEPFYLYLTKTWQKIGWIRMNEVFNNNNQSTIKTLVDYDIIYFTIDELKKMCNFIKSLRDLKISKHALGNSELGLNNYKKIHEEFGKEKARNIQKKLLEINKSQIFDLALFVED